MTSNKRLEEEYLLPQLSWPCILSRTNATEVLGLKASIRDRYDTNRIIYRCFLPDLTRFITVCCVPSNLDP